MFYYLGIGINFFLLFILVSKKGKSPADKILLIWLLVIGCHILLYTIVLQPITPISVYLLVLLAPLPFLHGPLLYLYTAAITNMQPSSKKITALHFLPAAISLLLFLPFLFMTSQQQMQIYLNDGKDYSTWNFILGIAMQLSGLAYVAWSFWLLRRHRQNIGNQFSYEERINLNWLRYLIYGLLAIWVIIIVFKSDELIFGAGVVFVTLLGFFGIRQVGIFNHKYISDTHSAERPDTESVASGSNRMQDMLPEPIPYLINQKNIEPVLEAAHSAAPVIPADNGPSGENISLEVVNNRVEAVSTEEKKKKYARSGLSVEMAEVLHKKLAEVMVLQKKYTEPELSLGMLAEILQVHPNYLSQVINEKEQCSFFDYINTLRVQEFKRLVAIPENSRFTIMSLAYDCGFNSKSSFNKNFKKITGQSPSEYLGSKTDIHL